MAGSGALAGVALVLLGAGTALIGSSLEDGSSQAGGNVPISSGATDPRDITANNSPSLARDPTDARRLVIVNRIDGPRFSCGLELSVDGGSSWGPGRIPFPSGEELPERCFAPDADFGPGGTLYVSFVTLRGVGNTPNALWTVSSRDGGRRFGVPQRVAGPLTFQARLLADRRHAGRLHLTWLQARDTGNLLFPETGYPVVASRSDDGGIHWSVPVRVSPPARERVVGASLAEGPAGDLYALYVDMGDDRLDYEGAHGGRGGEPYQGTWSLVLSRSGDGGESWQESDVDRGVVPIDRVIVFFPPTPSLAVDQSNGRVYVAFHDGRAGDADVDLWVSADGGAQFGRPVRVNDTPSHDGTWQYLPRVGVAPNGRVDVVYYDRRGDRSNTMNEVSLQSSTDGGVTFSGRVRLTDRSFDSRIGFGSERGMPDLGSRLGLLSTDAGAYAVWADTRYGTETSGKQDVMGVDVVVTAAAPARVPLRAGGALVAVAGVAAIAGAAIATVRRRLRRAGRG